MQMRWANMDCKTVTSPAVIVLGVSYAYGEGEAQKRVLENVDFTLARGEFAALTGHSGAGKTTLLTLIGAIRGMQEGEIDVLGHELAGRAAGAPGRSAPAGRLHIPGP